MDKLGKWVEGSVGTRLENAIEGLTFSPVLGGHSVTEYLETIGTQKCHRATRSYPRQHEEEDGGL